MACKKLEEFDKENPNYKLKPVHKSGPDAPAGAIYLFFDMS